MFKNLQRIPTSIRVGECNKMAGKKMKKLFRSSKKSNGIWAEIGAEGEDKLYVLGGNQNRCDKESRKKAEQLRGLYTCLDGVVESLERGEGFEEEAKFNNSEVAGKTLRKIYEQNHFTVWAVPTSSRPLMFGVNLEWPLYKGHLDQQASLLTRALKAVGEYYHVKPVAEGVLLQAGGVHVLYVGYKPSNG
jgi:hypothetical protein